MGREEKAGAQPRGQKRHKAGVGLGLWVGKPGPSSCCRLPSCCPQPASVTQSRKELVPQLLPSDLAPRPWVGRPPRQPHGCPVTVEAGREARANLEKMESPSGGRRKRGGERGRKEAFDAHHVCGIEYD